MNFKELRPYQYEDALFLARLTAAGCFNEPRTGKTPTSLAACELKGLKKILITAPASAVYPWADEFTRWTGRPCSICVGTKSAREKIISQWTDGLIISHDLLKTTASYTGDVALLVKAKPDACIVDEAHRFRNRGTARTIALRKLNKIPYRLALSGSISTGRSYDVWAILNWLYPKHFTSFWRFIEQNYITAQQMNYQTGKSYTEIIQLKPERVRWIQQTLGNLSTNRKRSDSEVMPWLPEKEYIPIRLQLTKEQRKYLTDLKENWEAEHVITKGTLDRLIRYRQICLAPALLELKGGSPKMDWIMDYFRDYPDQPTLIFSKFTSFIKLLQAQLKQRVGVIIGDTPLKQREQSRQDFQTGKLNILLINIDAGKEALTLDRAEAIIFTDKYPPVGDILQAEDRFVSTTEARADKAHKIYELIMRDSYDEEIYTMLRARKTETDIINNFKKYL